MTEKERYGFDVEREMRHLKGIVENNDTLTISNRFTQYLIEQAERVQELESLKNAFDDLDSDYIDLQQENERYREALEEINQLWERSTDATDDTNLAWKMSCEAHKALESGNGDN